MHRDRHAPSHHLTVALLCSAVGCAGVTTPSALDLAGEMGACGSATWTGADYDNSTPCPGAAAVAALEAEIPIHIRYPNPNLVCTWPAVPRRENPRRTDSTALPGPKGLTFLHERLVSTLAFLRHAKFSRPLPWLAPSETLWDWYRQRVRAIEVVPYGIPPAGSNFDALAVAHALAWQDVETRITYVTGDTQRYPGGGLYLGPADPTLVEVLLHEARHQDFPEHTCAGRGDSSRDWRVADGGPFGVGVLMELWVARYLEAPDMAPGNRELFALRADAMRATRYCAECGTPTPVAPDLTIWACGGGLAPRGEQ